MADFGAVISGDRNTELRLQDMPKRLHAVLYSRIEVLSRALEAAVEASAPFKSGKLRGSIKSWVTDAPARIVGHVSVGEDFAKAGALEYGAPGKQSRNQVAAHTARLTQVWGHRLESPLTVTISAHRRRLNIAEHRFLRGPAAAMSGRAIEEMRAAVTEVAAET